MQSLRILAASAVLDPSKRTVLPASAAVRAPRFTVEQWTLSATAREILDDINLPLTPRPERDTDLSESIVMCGAEIFNSLKTGGHVVRQRRTADLATLPDLAIAEPFAVVADTTLQTDAAAALAAMEKRRRAAGGGARIQRAIPTPAGRGAMWIAFTIAGAVVAMLAVVVVRGSLL